MDVKRRFKHKWSRGLSLVLGLVVALSVGTALGKYTSDINMAGFSLAVTANGAPSLTVTEPTGASADAPSYAGEATVTVSGTVIDQTGIAALTVNGVDITAKIDKATGNWSTSVPVTVNALNTITVTATDAHGKATTITRYVYSDDVKPTLSLGPIADSTGQNTVTVSGAVTDAGGIDRVTVVVGGNTYTVSAGDVNSNGEWSIDVPLSEGSNTITVTAFDKAGNPVSTTKTVTCDTVYPELTLGTVLGSTSANKVAVSGTATDAGTGVQSVTITNQSGVSTVIPGNELGTGGSFSADIGLVHGNNTITVTATDGTGNGSTKQVVVERYSVIELPAQNGSLTYDGTTQSPDWNDYEPTKMTLGGITSGVNAGDYEATFTPAAHYRWSDDSTAAKPVTWSIAKANGSLSLSETSGELTHPGSLSFTASSNSGGTITAASNNGDVATASVVGNTVTVTSGGELGSAVITISLAKTDNYTADSKSFTVDVSKLGWNISKDNNSSVMAYISDDPVNAGKYILSIEGAGAMKNWSYVDKTDFHADAYKTNITSVTIGDGITNVGDCAFRGFSGLDGQLVIPDSVTSIGTQAFQSCAGLDSLTLGKNVQTVGMYAFYGCAQLDGTLVIPDSVTEIGYRAFYECAELDGLTIGEKVQTIGGEAFYSCSALNGVLVIPDSVTSIGNGAFYCCTGLDGLTIGEKVQTIGNKAFYGCSALDGTLVIPNLVTSIGEQAFENCTALDGLTLGEKVQTIGYRAFNGCEGLDGQLVIPNTVTSIGNEAFNYCYGLDGALVIPGSVQTIGEKAFRYCAGLTSVTISDSVQVIGEGAFEICTGLTAFDVADANVNYCDVDGVLFTEDMTTLIQYPSKKAGDSYVVPDSVTSIGNYAFADGQSLINIDLGSVQSIGTYAFQNCNKIIKITIPDSVATIGNYVFYQCYVLKTVEFEHEAADMLSIGSGAFSKGNSSSLHTIVYVPDAANINTAITGYSWSGSKRTVTFLSGVRTEYNVGETFDTSNLVVAHLNSDGTTEIITGYTFEPSVALATTDTSATIRYEKDSKAYSATVGITVKKVLESIAVTSQPDKTEYMIGDTFEPVGMVVTATYSGGYTETITGYTYAPDGALAVGDNTITVTYSEGGVEKTATVDIKIGWNISKDNNSSVMAYISNDPDNDGMYTLSIEGSGEMKNWSSSAASDYHADAYKAKITSVTIGDGVTNIGNNAFYSATELKSVSIGNGVTSIGEQAFAHYNALTSITIPGTVTSIGKNAFYYNTDLAEVVIGSGVQTIGEYAFSYCSALTEVTIPASVTSIGSKAFVSCSKLAFIEFEHEAGADIQLPVAGSSTGAFYCTSEVNTELVTENAQVKAYDWAADKRVFDQSTAILYKNADGSKYTLVFQSNKAVEASYGEVVATYPGYGSWRTKPYYSSSSTPWSEYRTSITDVIIKDGVSPASTAYWFYDAPKLANVTIGNGVTSIGEQAFGYYNNLTSITIPGTVTSIGKNAFYYNTKLAEVNIGSGVQTIGDSAFSYCSALTEVSIPASVTSIGSKAFQGCNKMTAFDVADENTSYCDVDGVLYTEDMTTLIKYPVKKAGSSYAVPGSVTTISDSAVYGCTNLTSVTIPDSVTSIGKQAFSGCSALKVIEFGHSDADTLEIGESAFSVTSSVNTTIYGPDDANTNAAITGYNWAGGKRVVTWPLKSIAVTTAPTKVEYLPEETFAPAGMVVTATYHDNSTKAVDSYTFSPDGALTVADNAITISYTEGGVNKTTSQAITVIGTLDVTAEGYSGTYDGTEYGISVSCATDGATIKYGETEGSYTLNSSPTYTNAGTYTVYYQVTKAGYTTVTGSEQVVINKAANTVILSQTTGALTYPATSSFTVTSTSRGTFTAVPENSSIATATVGGTTVYVASGTTAGTTKINVTVAETDNYLAGTATYTVTVSAGNLASTITANGKTVTYDGNAHGITVSTTLDGATVKYGETEGNCTLNSSPTYTNAGTYTVYYQVSKAGYTTFTGSETVVIERAVISTVPTQKGTLTYDGTSKSPEWNGYDPAKMTLGGTTSGINVGPYDATFTPNGNYKWSSGKTTAETVTWRISKATPAVTLSQSSGTVVYPNTTFFTVETDSDGVLTVSTSDGNVATATVGGDGKTITVTPGTTAGNATITVKVNASDNYAAESATYTVTVNSGTLTVTANGHSGTYDGSAHGITVTCSGATIKYGESEGNYTLNSSPTYTNAGTYTVYYQVSKAGYTTVTGSKQVVINRASISTLPSQKTALTYTGTEQTVSWNNHVAAQLTVGGTTKGTNAGSYEATFTPTANYQWSDGSTTAKPVTWTIAKATQSAPAAPTASSRTDTSITLTTVSGAEYSKDGSNWQGSTSFTGLNPGQQYTFYVRYAETANKFASASSSAKISTTNSLQSIAITTAPTKTEYSPGETFDPAGMVVTATYADNSTKAVTGYTWTPNGALTVNNTAITISYTEGGVTKTATQTIGVYDTITPTAMLYSDGSMIFQIGNRPDSGHGTLTKSYTGFDTATYTSGSSVPWYENRSAITNVTFKDEFASVKPVSTAYWFYNNSSLTTITKLSNLNTSSITSMQCMFYNCKLLTSLDLSNFNTSSVTKMTNMFSNCSSLTSLNVSNFNTASVTGMGSMFSGCSGLTSLDLSNFNTASVTSMASMFSGCSGLTSLDLSNFNTSSVTKMNNMFSDCSSLTSLNVKSFNTSNVTTMKEMFAGCSSLVSLDISNFDTQNVKYMGGTNISASAGSDQGMFAKCTNLQSITFGSKFKMDSVIEAGSMFRNCTSLVTVDLSSVTSASNLKATPLMFYNCSSLSTIYTSIEWNKISTLTSSDDMFTGSTNLKGYSSSKKTHAYACFSGYFTYKAAPASVSLMSFTSNGNEATGYNYSSQSQ